MKHRLVAALAAASLLACGTARATASADATLSNLRVQLFALDPSRSGAPSVSFQATGGSLARVAASASPGSTPQTMTASSGAVFAPVDANDSAGADASGSASIRGDAFKDGAFAKVSASAEQRGANCEATSYFGDGENFTSFTLSPHSIIVITMMADLSATAGPSGSDYAIGSAELEFLGSMGDNSQQSLANALVSAGGVLGDDNTLHELLSVSFVNPFDFSIAGEFFGGIDATANAAPVPEPASFGLLLAGLAAMGATHLRRRR